MMNKPVTKMKSMQESAGRAFVFSLRSVQFGVVDLAAATDFFSGPWGLEVLARTPGSVYLRAAGGGDCAIGLHQRDKTEVLRADFRAASRAALEERHAALRAAGVQCSEVEPLSEPGGGYGLTFRDPDGRSLLLVAEDAQEATGSPRRDAPLKLSHLVLNSPQPQVLEDFYAGALGFRVVDRTRKMFFLNCNSDHHTIAVVPSDVTTLHHLAFELGGFDAVMRGIGRMRDAGYSIGWGVGRHGPGNNIFAYFSGYEGLPLEYTAEVQQIDETYAPGSVEKWVPTPGRNDQWGAAGPPSDELKKAEHRVMFSAEPFAAPAAS
ncbi:MAG: glyoxalase [Hyphomicrobiales bacterium]|jgi:catechol 2,3-dioxygenase|nr:glyoxalase [Hyphomicrobiales bacterium]